MATLLLFAAMRELIGERRVSTTATTVGDALTALVVDNAEAIRLLPYCSTWIGETRVDTTTELQANDEVAILPPVSGGDA